MRRVQAGGVDPTLLASTETEPNHTPSKTVLEADAVWTSPLTVDAQKARPSVTRGWFQGLLHNVLAHAEPIDGVSLPEALNARLAEAEKDWLKYGAAAGPLFVNGDLARSRTSNKKDAHAPETLEWLYGKGGATALTPVNVQALIGADVCITPTLYDHRKLHVEDTLRGVLEAADTHMGFVQYKLRQPDGTSLNVPFFGEYHGTSYVGVLHGHMIRETNDSAFRPEQDYRGLTVYARVLEGGPPRQVGQPAIGQVVFQDQSSLVLRTAQGEELRFSAGEGDLFQALVVPSTSLKAQGTTNWMSLFPSLEALIGQTLRIHFNPVSRQSSVVGRLTGVVPEGNGVRIQYRSAEGLALESVYNDPGHVLLSPSTQPVSLKKGAPDHPQFLGQMVDATLVDARVASSGYGAVWWVDETILERVRGRVVAQDADKLVIRALNGEQKTLDLSTLQSDGPLSGFHDQSATPYIHVSPHGMWAS